MDVHIREKRKLLSVTPLLAFNVDVRWFFGRFEHARLQVWTARMEMFKGLVANAIERVKAWLAHLVF